MRRPMALGLAACFSVLASCSLDLDESRIGRSDGGLPDASITEQPGAADAGDGGDGAAPGGLARTCAKDEDCRSVDACLAGKCDVARKTCVYDVCRPQACGVGSCDLATRTCGAPKSYPFKAAQFPVGAGVGCGGAAWACFAAVYPYVFVGTTNGVLAFRAADPSATTPEAVPVTGLTFAPQRVVASGSRLFFLGTPFGTGAASRVPIAWVDVPVDPFAQSLAVTGVLASWNKPAADGVSIAIQEGGTALLVDANPASSYAAARLEPPLSEPLALSGQPLPITSGTSPVAVSGSRLLMQALALPPQSGTGTPSYGFITGAGTAAAANGGDTPLTAASPVAPLAQTFAYGAEGSVVWVAEALAAPPATMPSYVKSVRAYFLVADANANVDASAFVDIQTYPPPGPGAYVVNQPLIGPAAILDGRSALVTSVPSGVPALDQTEVMFATKSPLGLIKNGDASVRKITIPLGTGALAAAASNGIGYVLASESSTAASVYVLDPGCAP